MKIKAKIDRMVNSGNVKAIASVSLDGMFVVKNLKIMDGKKGLFVSMPQETYSGKDGQKKYSNLFFALTNSAKLELQETVLQAYQQQIDPNYTPKQSYEETHHDSNQDTGVSDPGGAGYADQEVSGIGKGAHREKGQSAGIHRQAD